MSPSPATATAGGEDWVGVVAAVSAADLAVDVPSRVAEVFVRVGDTVAQGDRLVQLDPSAATASVDMASAQVRERTSELRSAEATARAAKKRLKRLQAGQAWLSRQELEQAGEAVRVAEAQLEAAKANLGVGRASLRGQRLRQARQTLVAPFAGEVVALDADVGDSVTPGQTVVRMFDRKRQVRFAFPPGAMSADARPRVEVRLSGQAEPVVTRIATVRQVVDPSAEMVFATAPLPDALSEPGRWIPGAPVAVRPVSSTGGAQP